MNLVREEGAEPLLQAHALLQGVDPWDAPQLESGLTELLSASGLKPHELYDPIRIAVTGDPDASGLFDTLAGLGREETLSRLETALASGR